MIAYFHRLWVQRRAVVITVVLLAGSGWVLGAVRYGKRYPTVPTVEMKREEFVDSLQFRGEVKALKSATISVTIPKTSATTAIPSQRRSGQLLPELICWGWWRLRFASHFRRSRMHAAILSP